MLLHSATNFSISSVDLMSLFPFSIPNSFSACSSTGNPCVSHPALKMTLFPDNTLYLYHKSLKTLPLRCPACGIPFIVGGPSINIISFFLPSSC